MCKRFIPILAAGLLHASIFAQSEDSPLFNPLAGTSTYDYNFKVGDTVIAIGRGLDLKPVKVYQKKNSMYKVVPLYMTAWEIQNDRNALKWYKANSVYPYFNVEDFNNKTKPYKNTIESLLNCLSQAKGIELSTLTGTDQWPAYYIQDDNQYNSMKAEIDNCLKVLKTFRHLPNTFLDYEDNPAVWVAVVNDGQTYLDCLKAVGNPKTKKILDDLIEEIEAAKTSANNFSGGTEGLDGIDYMHSAVSASKRKDFIDRSTGFNSDVESVKRINAALDELKIACASKLSLLKMPDWYYKYPLDAGSETIMKSYLKNGSVLKIHKKGSSDSQWLVKKNEYGIILYKYKRTQMLVRNPNNDHPYCTGLFFVLKQDYNGGGTYGGSTVSEYHDEICGCP